MRIPLLIPLILIMAANPARAAALRVSTPDLSTGDEWTMLRLTTDELSPFGAGWDGRTRWDLRQAKDAGRLLRFAVLDPVDAGLGSTAERVGADRAVCVSETITDRRLGCRLFRQSETGPTGPRILWSDLDGAIAGDRAVQTVEIPGSDMGSGESVRASIRTVQGVWSVASRAVAEGVVILPAGPREAVLLREVVDGEDRSRLRYRFLDRSGRTLATLEGSLPATGVEFVADRAELLVAAEFLADDGLEIRYSRLSEQLAPGSVGFLQYSLDQTVPLSAVDPGWTSVGALFSIDSTNVAYRPDPGDPSSTQFLPEVWDLTGLQTATLSARTFNTTRSDLLGNPCGENCAFRDLGATPPDGSWQAYLKLDKYIAGSFATRDIFELNDNDTGADPAIDVAFVSQDEGNLGDWTQICFERSAGAADRFLHIFRFFGADPAAATLGVGDTWNSGSWTSCSAANGLKLTAASVCDPGCWPACNAAASPFARGRLGGGVGFRSTILEDGFVHVPAGNLVPALLMRQDTDLEAGVDFIISCALGNTPNRSFDYFWLQEYYGLLGTISSVTDETIQAGDWSAVGNVTDRVDLTWGPYPPYQTEAEACLSGTRIGWSLPADGSNLNGEPGISDYGYVVLWGTDDDPEALADFDANPNRTPLPGEPGYLLAAPGSEPTSTVVTGFADPSINATVVTALRYTDPDAADLKTYRSAAFYKVVEDPARLDAGAFQIGNSVIPFVERSGADVQLTWPAVAGAAGYRIRVWDLFARSEIACPAGMNCTPDTPSATHPGAVVDGGCFAYRAFAVDPCGEESAN